MKRRSLFLFAALPLLSQAANLSLSGLVIDKAVHPLKGISVSLALAGNRTTTDSLGFWSLVAQPTGIAGNLTTAHGITHHLQLVNGRLQLDLNGFDPSGRPLRKAATATDLPRIAARSQFLGMDTLVYARNGIVLARAPLDTMERSGILQILDTSTNFPSLAKVATAVRSGTKGDTLLVSSLPSLAGWNLDLRVHSKAKGWESWTADNPLYGAGIDSLGGLWTRQTSLLPESSSIASVPVSHRYRVGILNRDRSTDSVWVTRIGGYEWFAQNLAYDIPGDTMDVCYGNDPSNCKSMGRYYTAAQALNLHDAYGKLNHDCDTLPNVGKVGSTCPTIDTQGVCPTGWRLPAAADWDSLTSVTDNVTGYGVSSTGHLYSGDWGSFTGSDWYGFDLKPAYAMGLEANRTWTIWGGLRSVFWASTPYQDQAVTGTAFVPADSYYGSHVMWYYNPSKAPRERSAYSVRCLRLPPVGHVAHDSANLDTLAWSVATGATADTLILAHAPSIGGWTTTLEVHSKSSGWTHFDDAGHLAPLGVDSLRATLTSPGAGEIMQLPARVLDHRFAMNVTYRDGSTGSVKAVRIGGKTWMAENLNYDIPGDTMDVCLGNDASKCAAFGRFYTTAQALNLLDTDGKLKHECDTLPNVGKTGAACPTIDPQGVCPAGWHIPQSAEWDALTQTTDAVTGIGVASSGRLYASDWGTFTGADWFGFGLKLSYVMELRSNKTWTTNPAVRAALWSSTPYQDQAVNGTAFEPTSSYYGSHAMWYYTPGAAPLERVAYPVRCVKN